MAGDVHGTPGKVYLGVQVEGDDVEEVVSLVDLLPTWLDLHGLPLPDAVLDLPAADYYVSLNAHQGRPEVLTAWMDPSINSG